MEPTFLVRFLAGSDRTFSRSPFPERVLELVEGYSFICHRGTHIHVP
jgi:hypothetical protein